jgi:signal transduction histidine kinase
MATEQDEITSKAQAAFAEYQQTICRRTDRFFAWLMLIQWLAGIATALWLAPLSWAGNLIQPQVHLWTALFLGGVITSFPIFLAFYMPGAAITRHVIAAAQVLMSALLIHLSGGRLETHFHVFGSLALLAFYRDWRVLMTAALIVAADHFVRGMYWPESVYGVAVASPWRAVEHSGWVALAVAFLSIGIRQSVAEMKEIALRQATLEVTKENIEAKVLRRTAQLQETVEQLEMFCHSVSHDLRAPLRGIRSFAQILAQDYAGNLDQFGRTCAERIALSAARLDALMRDLLEYTRVSRVAIKLEPVALQEALDEALTLLDDDIQTKDAIITVAPDLPVVEAHRSTLIQVLLNLLSNGLKFVLSGTRPQIQIGFDQVNGRVRFWVQDNGIGIDPRNFNRLFSVFQRLNAAQEYPGTGVGLAIVRKGVERMGGTVTLESELGKGTRFCIELAAAEPAIDLSSAIDPRQTVINTPLPQQASPARVSTFAS